MDHCSAKKKKSEILTFGTIWMKEEAIMFSEISKFSKSKYVFPVE